MIHLTHVSPHRPPAIHMPVPSDLLVVMLLVIELAAVVTLLGLLVALLIIDPPTPMPRPIVVPDPGYPRVYL